MVSDDDFDDPFPRLRELRESGPVHVVRGRDGMDRWLVTRYDDVVRVLTDPRFSSSMGAMRQRSTVTAALDDGSMPTATLITADPPEHTRLRREAGRAFRAARVDALRPLVRRTAEELLRALPDDDPVDLVTAFTKPLALRTICAFTGAPARYGDRFDEAATAINSLAADEAAVTATQRALASTYAYFHDLVEEKRQRPGDDYTSDLVRQNDERRVLSGGEVVSTCLLMFLNGFHTNAELLANGVLALLRDPGTRALVRADPASVPRLVEECLRHDGPVNPGMWRWAVEDVEIAGTTIPRGACVLVAVAAANRDPDVFPDPDEFDVRRAGRGHLAFGHGAHRCLGAALARAEAEIGIEVLLARRPRVALAVEPTSLRRRVSVLSGLRELPARLGPAEE
ncbi:cytochrome P450 [Umezawaea sp. NPDC059074]|uniref:cytochrome P450 family protein n=1 Tax=Umezawaea sp. NPDC059074 TaxID=3346716 RepID=UPI0036A84CC7